MYGISSNVRISTQVYLFSYQNILKVALLQTFTYRNIKPVFLHRRDDSVTQHIKNPGNTILHFIYLCCILENPTKV